MGKIIYWEKMYIKGCFETNCIQEFSFTQTVNEHARAKVRCMANQDSLESCGWQLLFKEIQISAEGEKRPIFVGIIEEAEIEQDGERLSLFLNIVSGTFLLDQEKHCRSFGKRQSYKNVMEYILMEQGKAIYTAEDRDIPHPVIQYEETDWEFLKRMAGNLKTSITPDINSVSNPRMYVGLRSGEDQQLYDTNHYIETRRNENRCVFTYKVETYDDWKVGDEICFKGKSLRICEKSGEMRDGELLFCYVLSTDSYSKRQTYHNQKLKGKEIIGKVIDTKGEWVKIHMEPEVFEEHELSFYYKWLPETGNLLYCMPETGTFVTLYFCSKSEESGICINCVRKNQEESRKYWNTQKKRFALPDGKTLILKPDKITLKGQGGSVRFMDETGININSSHEVQLIAGEDILFCADTILTNAPEGIDIIRKDILKPTIINIYQDFDIKGKIGRVEESLHYDDKELPVKVFHGGK